MGDARVTRDGAQDGHQRRGVKRLQGGGSRILRGEIHEDLHLQARPTLALDGRFVAKLLGFGDGDPRRGDHETHLFVLGGQGGLRLPGIGTDPFGPIPHQPFHFELALADVEGAFEESVAFGIFFNGGHAQLLGKVGGRIGAFAGRIERGDAEENAEQVFATGQFAHRDRHFVAGVKSQIEAEDGLGMNDGARQVGARVAGFQYRFIGTHQTRVLPGAVQEDLRVGQAGDQTQKNSALAAEANQTSGRKALHNPPTTPPSYITSPCGLQRGLGNYDLKIGRVKGKLRLPCKTVVLCHAGRADDDGKCGDPN